MTFELTAWQVITLMITLIGAAFGAGRVLFARIESSIKNQHSDLVTALIEVKRETAQGRDETRALEREFFKLRAELPQNYVHKDDFNRTFTVIDAKLDKLWAITKGGSS